MRRSWKLLAMLAAVVLIGVGVHWLSSAPVAEGQPSGQNRTQQAQNQQPSPNQQTANQGGGNAAPKGPVPVLAGAAGQADVPIFVRGIGTVQAFNTVTVKSRVDGNIAKVAFTEGQYVRAGDLLVQIDPRPYQAQLE